MNFNRWKISPGNLILFFAFIAFIAVVPLLPALFPNCGKLNLYLQAIGVTASSIIAIFAIWGDAIKARWLGPKLRLSLFKQEGQLTFISDRDQTPVRYYHLKVENRRKGIIARNVQVILSSIESPYPGGTTQKVLVCGGRIPFSWGYKTESDEKAGRSLYSSIGPADICDLANLRMGGHLTILAARWNIIRDHVVIGPNQWAIIEAIAIAENAQSNTLKLKISWDGQWPEDDIDAPTHIRIDPLKK